MTLYTILIIKVKIPQQNQINRLYKRIYICAYFQYTYIYKLIFVFYHFVFIVECFLKIAIQLL